MKNVQKITLAAVLAIATSPALAINKPACFSKLSMPACFSKLPAMSELGSKHALIATATVAAVGGLYVAYNKGLIGKAATAIQDIVTTHPRKTAAVLVTATALIVANHFGYLDGAKDAVTSLFKKAEVKAVDANAPKIEGAAKDINKDINNVVDNAGSKIDTSMSTEAPKVPNEVSGNNANVKPGTSDVVTLDATALNAADNAKIVTILEGLTAKIDDLMSKAAVSNSEDAAKIVEAVKELKSVLEASNSANTAKFVEGLKEFKLSLDVSNAENTSGILAAIKNFTAEVKADNAAQTTTIISTVTDMGNSVVAKVKDIFAALKAAPVLSDNSQIGL